MAEKMKFYSLWLCLSVVMVFILQYIFPSITNFGILNNSAISNYEFWRFFTSIFLHGSLPHLLYNLFALFFFGIALEKLIGSKKFLFAFFASGIIANIIAVNFYQSSLGASGAIMGIIGVLTIVKPMLMVWAFGLILPMFIAGILWVTGSILGSLGMFPGDTGYIAHLVGIAIGLIIGIFLRLANKENKKSNNKIEIHSYYIENWEERHLK
ncbi:MAG: rhomboid family intramembrane serine protease [Nanoarchaeota archaeon]|mgnify:CR=1 FL=1